MSSLPLDHQEQPLEADRVFVAGPCRCMGRPGHYTGLTWDHLEDRGRDETHELPTRVSIQRSHNKSLTSSEDSFSHDALILLIGNVRQHGSHRDEHGNTDTLEIFH